MEVILWYLYNIMFSFSYWAYGCCRNPPSILQFYFNCSSSANGPFSGHPLQRRRFLIRDRINGIVCVF